MKPAGFFVLLILMLMPVRTEAGAQDYLPGYVVVKTETPLDEYHRNTGMGNELSRWVQANTKEARPVLPAGYTQHNARITTDKARSTAGRLVRTYIMKLNTGEDPLEVAERISQFSGVVYAEPRYTYSVQEVSVIPNDTMIGEPGHDYFEYHRIFDAWEVNRSSSSIVISIVDTGVYYDHPELKNKLWRNPEPGRASEVFPQIENDTIGWNFWQSGDIYAGEEPEQNADPVGDYNDHGTHVAGIAAAEPDNGLHIAGTGYHARYMPVKAGGTKDYPGNVPYGIDGILYAALNDADVINASFGSPNYSRYARDVMRMATEMGSLVVAAAGNEGNEEPFYPAAYPEVLSVGALDNSYDDALTGFSTYGYWMDMFAIGRQIYSTSFDFNEDDRSWKPDYRRTSGTSMASPVVAGIAALLRNHYPDWSPDRVRMQLRNSSQSIREANAGLNPYFLGQGKLNALNALAEAFPGVELKGKQFVNDDGEKLDKGESGEVHIELINHGAQISDLYFTSSTQQDGFELTDDGVARSWNAVFETTIPATLSNVFDLTKYPETILKYNASESDYEDFSLLRFEDFYFDEAQSAGLRSTFSSDGGIGYRFIDRRREGTGIIPEGMDNPIIKESGLMLSLFDGERTRFIDAVRAEDSVNRHFETEKLFRARGDLSMTRFTAANHPEYRQVDVELKVHTNEDEDTGQTITLEYRLTNPTDDIWYNVYAGVFTDWALSEMYHRADYSEIDSLHYVYDKQEELYATFAHIGPLSSALAIDNHSEMTLDQAENRQDSLSFGTYYHPVDSRWNGFTINEKRLAFTAGTERTILQAEDLGTVSASGPYTIYPGEEARFGFVLGWAWSLEELQSQVQAAREKASFELTDRDVPVHSFYEEPVERPVTTKLLPGYPNPFNHTTNLTLELAQQDEVQLEIYNIAGRKVATLADGQLEQGRHTFTFDASGLASGVYVVVAQTHTGTLVRNVTLIK